MKTFLTASWRNLVLAQYPVPADRLRPYLPPGVELDEWDGRCWASLVGFQFLDTRVLGVSWPGFRDFPEWNLRFYVRRGDQRGVCFVREFVPQWFVATVARVVYNEPYRAAQMGMNVDVRNGSVFAAYQVDWGGRTHDMRAVGGMPAEPIRPGSAEDFFLNQAWGFGTSRRGECIRYEVTHPAWEVYPIWEYSVDVDWATLYGPEWEPMNRVEPASVYMVAGSAVGVAPHGAA